MVWQESHSESVYATAHREGAAQLSTLLNWLRRLLAWQIALTRQTYGPLADDSYRGLYIPSAEADLLSAEPPNLPANLSTQRIALTAEREVLAQQEAAAEHAGTDMALPRLARLFGLTQLERDILLLAIAPELDLGFERIYAYIQNDVSRRRPSVDLALRLLCTTPAERLAGHAIFEHDAPLLEQRLIQLFDDGQRRPSLLARCIKLDDRIVAELRCGQHPVPLDPVIASFVTLSRPTRSLDTLMLPVELRDRLRKTVGAGLVLGLQGGYGSGRRIVAEALCALSGWPLLSVDLAHLSEGELVPASGGTPGLAEYLERIVREARLRQAALLWLGAERLLSDQASSGGRSTFLAALDRFAGCSFLLIDRPWEARGTLPHRRFLRIELPPLSFGERERMWQLRLNGDSPDLPTLQALASTFRLSAGQIRDAVAMARSLAGWRADDGSPLLTRQDLYQACRAQSSGRLDSLAHKIRTTYVWDDIVLPPDQVSQLREICLQLRHRRTVLESWGFDRHLAMGKGVNVLFAGPSGTGKTMAAEIIAADLGLELYKIDLSMLVSKYIGETEKNLDRIFTAAREANAILFFDEADALFGKRSEVKDAHDRYANIEVGYLLQKMEEYDGVVILATNLRKNMDEAFIRRLHVAGDFPFPEEDDRLRIWRKSFPPAAPLAANVDMTFLARQFKLAGGNIRNITLLAAFLSAEDGTPIGMAQIVRAIRREYQKLGKLVTEAEFGRWLGVARG